MITINQRYLLSTALNKSSSLVQQTGGSKQIDGSTINALHKHTYCVQMNRSATGFKIFRLQENGHWSVLVVEVGTTCWCQILGPDELLQLLVTMGVKKIGGQEKLMQPGVASP